MIDTIKLPRTRVSPRPNRLSTCLNLKFLFNYISTPFCKEGSLKCEPRCAEHFSFTDWFTGAFDLDSYVTHVLHSARISNVEIVLCGNKERRMVNFKIDHEMRKNVMVSMPKTWDKEKSECLAVIESLPFQMIQFGDFCE